MPIPPGCLCLVTNRLAVSPDARTTAEEIAGLERQLDLAIESEIDVIQIRERDLEAKTLQQLVLRVASRSSGSSTQVVVNDRADVALTVPDAGVHLRSDGPDPSRVRALLGSARLLGKSV